MEGRHCLSAASVILGLAEVPSEAAAQESKYLFTSCVDQNSYVSNLVFVQVKQQVNRGKNTECKAPTFPDVGSNTALTCWKMPRSCWRYSWWH